MRPRLDETAGSFAFRLAQTKHQSLIEFCQRLGLSYHQARSDVDHLLPAHFANELAGETDVSPNVVRHLALPETWTVSTWDKAASHHAGSVRFCPACLKQNRHGRRFWRTCFAAACPEHGVELITSCPHCGKHVPYFGAPGRILLQFWLENWPVCPSCLGRLDSAPARAHPTLVAMCRHWRAALSGEPWHGSSSADFLKLSSRLIRLFGTTWRYQITAALATSLTCWPAHLATALLIEKLAMHNPTEAEFYAALGMSFDPSQLARDIVN